MSREEIKSRCSLNWDTWSLRRFAAVLTVFPKHNYEAVEKVTFFWWNLEWSLNGAILSLQFVDVVRHVSCFIKHHRVRRRDPSCSLLVESGIEQFCCCRDVRPRGPNSLCLCF